MSEDPARSVRKSDKQARPGLQDMKDIHWHGEPRTMHFRRLIQRFTRPFVCVVAAVVLGLILLIVAEIAIEMQKCTM
ncbi:hypothetical protein [Burkholderia latens]|uniref:Uncharacterized protein n=2 Tax=Burkholderia latens TaxID=488446 RepID=A0A6H9T6Q3_9BURK|nr:hypothetical protein [Burkholderia latens]KAB0644801.1 hypothetical protein F7R21_00335 [Burkholderia latens]